MYPALIHPPNGLHDIKETYNCLEFDSNGVVLVPRNWGETNLAFAILPLALPTYDGMKTAHICIHIKLVASLEAIMTQIHRNHPNSYNQLFFSGSYVPRMKRGIVEPSVHATGAALDFNGDTFPLERGKVYVMSDMPLWFRDIVAVFHAYGWKWGGDFGDPMHFQAATGY